MNVPLFRLGVGLDSEQIAGDAKRQAAKEGAENRRDKVVYPDRGLRPVSWLLGKGICHIQQVAQFYPLFVINIADKSIRIGTTLLDPLPYFLRFNRTVLS